MFNNFAGKICRGNQNTILCSATLQAKFEDEIETQILC